MKSDFIIVGGGLSGLICALKLAPFGRVTLITKGKIPEANSTLAQGGIAATVHSSDSAESHIQDTLTAGAYLNHIDVVRKVVEEGPRSIAELQSWGVHFDLNPDQSLNLHREGGHSQRRIVHIGDRTGSRIHQTLLARALSEPNIVFAEDFMATDLILNPEGRCAGVVVWKDDKGEQFAWFASHIVLATGGAGRVFKYTSNWRGATGDGIAIAYRAGAPVANLEFTQFHPTCLYHHGENNFLISEAVRGEGARLVDQQGKDIMAGLHPMGALAPRDIVSRSIDSHMKKSGAECVYLDLTHLSADFTRQHFPEIYHKCLSLGLDITKSRIPVVPASHYMCGGIVSELCGRTEIPGLWVIGESAHTGLHGANRLASNSLLECLVSADLCVRALTAEPPTEPRIFSFEIPAQNDRVTPDLTRISTYWRQTRELMWEQVGIERSNERLLKAQNELRGLLHEVEHAYITYKLSTDLIELRNLVQTAVLIVECALSRKESRGVHFNIDYPATSDEWAKDTILRRD